MAKILVVDDTLLDRRLVGGLLEKEPQWAVRYAENGVQALASIQAEKPDVIVTDLQMPEMNGLELVQAVALQYEDLPVILITGHGSEDLAVEALAHGAASYVPKSRLGAMLLDTVANMLALAEAGHSYGRLIAHVQDCAFRFELDNDPELIEPLVDLAQNVCGGVGLCDPVGRMRLGLALEHALLNAMFRGNLEISRQDMLASSERLMQGEQEDVVRQRRRSPPYADRRVRVRLDVTPARACFVIADDGPGFDVSQVPSPGDPRALELDGGRGLVLMRTFMDEMTFNARGNEVTLVKRRDEAGG